MARRIVVFGATGYTGRLIASALVRQRQRPVLAGRSHQYLAALGVKLGKGLDTAVADIQHPESLLELIQPNDILVSTVGPFARFGRPVVEACIYRRAIYIDTAGEPQFLRMLYEELSPIADQAKVALLPAFGFEYVAGDVAASVALEGLGESATRIDVGYFLRGPYRGNLTMGTRASAAGAALVPHHARRDGALQSVTAAERTRPFTLDGRTRHGISVGGGEHFTVPRFAPWIREVNVYQGGLRSRTAARATGRMVAAAVKIPGAPRATALLGKLPVGAEGPADERRQKTGSEVVAEAYAADGRMLREVRLRGGNPYTFTGEIVAWAAVQLSREGIERTGAVGPVEAFGSERLLAACAAAGLPVAES